MGIVSIKLDSDQYPKDIIDPANGKLILLDGREIELYPKEEKTDKVIGSDLRLDSSGIYLRLGEKTKIEEDNFDKMIEKQYNHQIFFENAWFFLEHAEIILKDSRMYLAPVKIQNGIAYTGTSGFQHPTLGIYLEWWLNFREAAIDGNGNPIWYISGSPLSGNNCCKAATMEGNSVKINQRTSFSNIWSSFCKVNNRYNEVKLNYESYSLEEVLIRLRGEGYLFRIQELKYELRERERRQEIARLRFSIEMLSKKLSKNIAKNKQLEMHHNKLAIKDFMAQYSRLQKEYEEVHAVYLKKYKDLKHQLHNGSLESDYHYLLSVISRDTRKKKHEMSDLANKFMLEIFGKNPNSVSLKDVLKYAKHNL